MKLHPLFENLLIQLFYLSLGVLFSYCKFFFQIDTMWLNGKCFGATDMISVRTCTVVLLADINGFVCGDN